MPPIPRKKYLIDASLYKDSSNCLRKTRNVLIKGLHQVDKKHKMEYGTAFHKFVASWHKGEGLAASISKALAHFNNPDIQVTIGKDWRTSGHLLNTCRQYADAFPWQTDRLQLLRDKKTGELITEARFAYPFKKIGEYEFVLAGTIDAPCLYDIRPTIADHKTTSCWDAEDYLRGYELSDQLCIYKYVTKKLAKLLPNTFGMFDDAGCLINGIFISKQTEKNPGGVIFRRSEIIEFTEEDLRETEERLSAYCARIYESLKNNYWPRNRSFCDANPYGERCMFFDACVASSKFGADVEEEYLKASFVENPQGYNPMVFGE